MKKKATKASTTKNTTEPAKQFFDEAKRFLSDKYTGATTLIGAISADDIADKFTEYYTEIGNKFLGTQASIYDKAMDAHYIETKLGGKYHRLFDQGHDPLDAWEKVKSASPDDSFIQEVAGYASAMTKDFVTKMGMPFDSMAKPSFDMMVEKLSNIPGLDKAYLYDALTVNAAELTASALSVVGLAFAFKAEDKRKVSEILGTVGISTIASGNPILGVITIASTAYAYKKKQIEFEGLTVGSGMTLLSISIFSILGFPVLAELIIVLLVSRIIRTNLLENEELRAYFRSAVANIEPREIIARVGKMPGSIAGLIQDIFPMLRKKTG